MLVEGGETRDTGGSFEHEHDIGLGIGYKGVLVCSPQFMDVEE